MHDRELEETTPRELRAGLRVSVVSIAWTVFASAVAVVLGLSSASLVLLAFGLTGLMDAAGSMALTVHFRHALRHEAISERHERASLLVVTVGLLIVGAVTTIESVLRFLDGGSSRPSSLGIAISAASIVVLGVLAHRKRRTARRIPSRALLVDASLSATGCLIALVSVCGTALSSTLGWWWLDPTAALCVAIGALAIVGILIVGAWTSAKENMT